MAGLCPKCSARIDSLRGESVPADFGHASFWSILLTCPACQTILSTQIDPTLIREEIVKRITDDVASRLSGTPGTEPLRPQPPPSSA